MKYKGMIIIMITLLITLFGCKIIDTVTDELEVAGYDVVENERNVEGDFNVYSVYDGETLVAYIYAFSTFRKARDYYEQEELDLLDDGMTWITHNQLIIGAIDDNVIDTIVH